MKVNVATLNVKLLGAFALAAFLAACDTETPEKAEVVYQDAGACNVEGSVAHFKQGQKDQVFFDFDKSKIIDENAKVSQMKDFLCKYNKVGSVVGHCDTRGSSEYNLALGQRRANALKKSLVAHGLPAASICGAYSVGKERPLVVGNTEECHAQNRTSIFVVNNDSAGAEVSVTEPAAAVEPTVVSCVE